MSGFFYNDNVYVIFDEHLRYAQAINRCKNVGRGGTLARHLDDAAYRNLRSHVNDGTQYWIGLSNRHQHTNTTRDCLLWAGSQLCANVHPLQILNQPNSQRCRAVSVKWETNQQPSIPQPTITRCAIHKPFICQFPILRPALATLTTTSSSTASSFVTALIAALSITGLLLIFMMILFLCYCTRKGWCNKFQRVGILHARSNSSKSSKNHNIKEARKKTNHNR